MRSSESPILRAQPFLSGIAALKEDAGGYFDCVGGLRGDNGALCPGCGRSTCDGGVQVLF